MPHSVTDRHKKSVSMYLESSYRNHTFAYSMAFVIALLNIANNIAGPYFLTRTIRELKSKEERNEGDVLLWVGVFTISWLISKLLPLTKDEVLQPLTSEFSRILTTDVVRASYDQPMLQRITYSTPPSVHHFGISYEHIGRSFVDGLAGKIIPSFAELVTAGVLIPAKFGAIGIAIDSAIVTSLLCLKLFNKKVSKSQNAYIYGLMKTYAFIISRLDEYANVHYFGALERQLVALSEGITRLDNFLNKSILIRNRVSFLQSTLATGLALLGSGLLFIYRPLDINISLEEFVWITLYLFQIFPAFHTLGEAANKLTADRESFDSIIEFLNSAQAERGIDLPLLQITSETATVSFADIFFRYEDGQEVLHDFSLEVPAGKTILITGSSGAGKSSLFKILQRFYKQQHGTVKVAGQDITTRDVESLRGVMAIVPQIPVLSNTSIYENVKYANPDASDEEIIGALKRAGLSNYINRMDFEVGSNGARLSGGQKQRLAIARAYLRDKAPILLMDEPTSALDPMTEKEILLELNNLLEARHRTTLIISHRFVMIAHLKKIDSIIYLDQGKIAESGTFEELMAKDGLFAAQIKMAEGEEELHRRREMATKALARAGITSRRRAVVPTVAEDDYGYDDRAPDSLRSPLMSKVNPK